MGSWKQGNNFPLVDSRNHCYNQVAAKKLRAFICQWLSHFYLEWGDVLSFSLVGLYFSIVGWTNHIWWCLPYLVTQTSNCTAPSLTWMFNTILLQMWVVERNKVHRIYVYFSLSCSYAPVDSKWNDVWSTWNGEGSSVYFGLSSWITQKLSQWMQSLHNKNVANLLLISWPICYWEGYTYFKVSFHYIILGMTLEKIQLASH